MEYVDVGTYSMRLHTVRLTELLYLPRLRQLRLVVPGLHDDVDAGAFLGVNFMRQLREGCLQRLDITLLSDTEQGGSYSFHQLTARPVPFPLTCICHVSAMPDICHSSLRTAIVVSCTFPWPGRNGRKPLKAKSFLKQNTSSEAPTLQPISLLMNLSRAA